MSDISNGGSRCQVNQTVVVLVVLMEGFRSNMQGSGLILLVVVVGFRLTKQMWF